MSQPCWMRIKPILDNMGIRVSPAQQATMEAYVQLLLHWNRRINLTGARDEETVYTRHILDCLMLETVPMPKGSLSWLDVGSGAGLPGLILALMHPDHQISSVDTVAKKITFQQEAARRLALPNFHPRRVDINQLADETTVEAQRPDIVVARAFASLETLLRLGAKLLKPGGQLWAMKGKRVFEELSAADPRLLACYQPDPIHYPYDLIPGKGDSSQSGVIVVFRLNSGNDKASSGDSQP